MFTRRIRISLQVPYDDDGAPFFRPGAILSGQVSYKAPTSDRVSSITVDFRGESQVDSDKIQLFHRQYVIKDDSSNYLDINSRQTYDFPFQFTAPEMTELDCTNGYPTSSPESFVDSHHPLPPSFGADQSRHAKIVYVIYATVTRVSSVGGYRYHLPATHGISNLKCLHTTLPRYEAIQPEPLGWFKQPMVESPVPQNSKTQLDAEVGALPVYQAVINVPSTAVLGEKIPLISIICPKDRQPDCRIHAVDLNFSVSVSLQAETHSRHKSLTGCPPITEIKALPLKTELPCTSTTAVGSPQSVGCCTKAAVSWPPSYKSYLVSRSYNLVVDISVNKKGSKANHIAHFQVPISVSVPHHSHLNRVLDYDERVQLGRGQVAMYDEEPPAYDSLRS
ncbi:MAG: hypothetical protein Q9163_005111 [Psora crenata]